MAIQSIYIFGLYPCMNIKNKTTYDKIFNNVRPYMLLIFYILIAFYAFQDLGNSGGAGVIFFIIVSYFTGNASWNYYSFTKYYRILPNITELLLNYKFNNNYLIKYVKCIDI